MKRILFLLSIVSCTHAFAQQQPNPFPRTINVSGSAEMEVIPDEIYVRVDLQEFQKKGNKVNIDKIKSDFLASLRGIGIPDSAISIDTYTGYNDEWWKKRKKDGEDLTNVASYEIKLRSVAKLDQLVSILDDDATRAFEVVRTSHTMINQYRKELKIQAVKAAREKAEYLAAAVDEKIGVVVSINEANEGWTAYPPLSFANTIVGRGDGGNMSVDFRKLKLRFEINAVFALK